MGGYLGRGLECGFLVGKGLDCKPFRKSEVVWRGSISEMRISIGFGCGFGDLDFGCGKVLWKTRRGVGNCFGIGCGKVVEGFIYIK
jgi:hypothetical protein